MDISITKYVSFFENANFFSLIPHILKSNQYHLLTKSSSLTDSRSNYTKESLAIEVCQGIKGEKVA